MAQIALPLTLGDGDELSRIVIGNANQSVAEALADPGAWPYKAAVLCGPPRSGKSLLARWFVEAGLGEAIDDAQSLPETDIFHRWNRAQETGQPLLLVSSDKGWDIALPDLASRVGAALSLEIGIPDDDMVSALIESHAARRGLALGEGALTYLGPRVVRSFESIERLVAAIDRLSLERKAPPTLSIWRDALEAVQGAEQPRLL